MVCTISQSRRMVATPRTIAEPVTGSLWWQGLRSLFETPQQRTFWNEEAFVSPRALERTFRCVRLYHECWNTWYSVFGECPTHTNVLEMVAILERAERAPKPRELVDHVDYGGIFPCHEARTRVGSW